MDFQIEPHFTEIRRSMRAPGVAHELCPVPVFFRVLDDFDIHLSKVRRPALLARLLSSPSHGRSSFCSLFVPFFKKNPFGIRTDAHSGGEGDAA